MNILVLNGSPKGKYSITLQTVLYLQKLHPEHYFEVLNVGQTIKSLEKDFSKAIAAVEKAELLLFSYPVYTFIAPSQLHRFIELLKEAKLDLRQKFATQITTSKHFYDITAHRYIQDNCQDLGMKFIRGLSADMDDLLCDKGRKEAKDFFRYVLWCIDHDHFEPLPAPMEPPAHAPVTIPRVKPMEKSGDVVIVTDCAEDDVQLAAMIARFRARFPRKTRIVNLRDYPFRGAASDASTAPFPVNASTPTASMNTCVTPSSPPSPSSTPSPSRITPWARSLRCTMTGSSATVTAPSPSACPWAI